MGKPDSREQLSSLAVVLLTAVSHLSGSGSRIRREARSVPVVRRSRYTKACELSANFKSASGNVLDARNRLADSRRVGSLGLSAFRLHLWGGIGTHDSSLRLGPLKLGPS